MLKFSGWLQTGLEGRAERCGWRDRVCSPSSWFGMDWQGTAGKEAQALQARQQYLGCSRRSEGLWPGATNCERVIVETVITMWPRGRIVLLLIAALLALTWTGSLEQQRQLLPARKAIGSCDARYPDACVPIDIDVDCAGGRGDGPSYIPGPFLHSGPSDPHDLDRDRDGVACEPAAR
jgi:hypothetical protein